MFIQNFLTAWWVMYYNCPPSITWLIAAQEQVGRDFKVFTSCFSPLNHQSSHQTTPFACCFSPPPHCLFEVAHSHFFSLSLCAYFYNSCMTPCHLINNMWILCCISLLQSYWITINVQFDIAQKKVWHCQCCLFPLTCIVPYNGRCYHQLP